MGIGDYKEECEMDNDRVINMEEKLDLILRKLASVDAGQEELKSNQVDIFKCFDEIEKKTDAIMEQVGKNAESITDLKETQQSIGNVINQIAIIQQRQEDTINILSRRSIDQEAEIKRIQ